MESVRCMCLRKKYLKMATGSNNAIRVAVLERERTCMASMRASETCEETLERRKQVKTHMRSASWKRSIQHLPS